MEDIGGEKKRERVGKSGLGESGRERWGGRERVRENGKIGSGKEKRGRVGYFFVWRGVLNLKVWEPFCMKLNCFNRLHN